MDDQIKQTLDQSLKALEDQVTQALNAAKEMTERVSCPDWGKEWNIVTALVPQTEAVQWQEKHLYPVDKNIASIFQPQWERLQAGELSDTRGHREYFWKGSYADWQAAINRNDRYTGTFQDEDGGEHIFHYRLRPSHELRLKERQLYTIAALYQIRRPVIFSPLARRQISICLEEPIEEETFFKGLESGRCDFDWTGNGLSDRILENQELVWNIRTYPVEGQGKPVPDLVTGASRHALTFTELETHSFVILDQPGLGDEFYEVAQKEENTITLYVPDDFAGSDGLRLDLEQLPDVLPQLSFTNGYEPFAWPVPPRLISQGDVERAVQRYLSPDFSCSQVSLRPPKQTRPLGPYDESDIYGSDFIRENSYQKRRSTLPRCYLTFTVKNLEMKDYLTDYACYVLNDLDFRFPDFSWQGLVKDNE